MFFYSRQLFRLFCLLLAALCAHKLKKLAMQNSASCLDTLILLHAELPPLPISIVHWHYAV